MWVCVGLGVSGQQPSTRGLWVPTKGVAERWGLPDGSSAGFLDEALESGVGSSSATSRRRRVAVEVG